MTLVGLRKRGVFEPQKKSLLLASLGFVCGHLILSTNISTPALLFPQVTFRRKKESSFQSRLSRWLPEIVFPHQHPSLTWL